MSSSWLPTWRLNTSGGVVAPDERLPAGQTIALGLQHVVAMFGSTVMAPLLMGFDTNVAILMSGIGTLIFFLVVRGKVPSYVGSSFAFIGVIITVTGYSGTGANTNIATALGGIIACGAVYAIIGVAVHFVGAKWIERYMPPVVTGAIVAVIGLNLAAGPIQNMAPSLKATPSSQFDVWIQGITFLSVACVAVFSKGMLQRLLILIGLIFSYIVYYLLANQLGLGAPIDFSGVANAPWIGMPNFASPEFDPKAMGIIVPVVVILVAENLGHIKAVSAMTGQDLSPHIGKAFIGDGIATMVSGSVGGTGVTTYSENIGVMAATKIYSTLVFVVAALFAIILGFSPKFGALIQTIPVAVMGGISIVVFGLITVSGAKIWVENKVDFSKNSNLMIAAIVLILGTGGYTIHLGSFTLDGIGTSTFIAIILNAILNPSEKT